MEIYSIGFTKKSAGEFFGALKAAGIERLLDVRLNNTSQLAGFAKQSDLKYFLEEICGAAYEREPLLAPTQEILDLFKKQKRSWETYTEAYLALIRSRKVESAISQQSFERRTVLLCSEASAEHCHRRLALEYLQRHWNDVVIHHL
jgi:uncharacterized protein (DUF488 family)